MNAHHPSLDVVSDRELGTSRGEPDSNLFSSSGNRERSRYASVTQPVQTNTGNPTRIATLLSLWKPPRCGLLDQSPLGLEGPRGSTTPGPPMAKLTLETRAQRFSTRETAQASTNRITHGQKPLREHRRSNPTPARPPSATGSTTSSPSARTRRASSALQETISSFGIASRPRLHPPSGPPPPTPPAPNTSSSCSPSTASLDDDPPPRCTRSRRADRLRPRSLPRRSSEPPASRSASWRARRPPPSPLEAGSKTAR